MFTLSGPWIQTITTAAVTLAGVFGLNKTLRADILKFVQSNAGTVADLGNAALKTLEAAAGSPAVAAVEHSLKTEVDRASTAFQTSEIGRLALAGLHAFGSDLSALSTQQMEAVQSTILQAFPHLPLAEIESAVKDAQAFASSLAASPLFTSATAYTKAKQAALAAAQPASPAG